MAEGDSARVFYDSQESFRRPVSLVSLVSLVSFVSFVSFVFVVLGGWPYELGENSRLVLNQPKCAVSYKKKDVVL